MQIVAFLGATSRLADICSRLGGEHFGDELHPNAQGAKIIGPGGIQGIGHCSQSGPGVAAMIRRVIFIILLVCIATPTLAADEKAIAASAQDDLF